MGFSFDWMNENLKNIQNEKTFFNVNGFGDNSRFFSKYDNPGSA